MSEILHDLSPERLAAAIDASHLAYFTDLGRSPRVTVRQEPGMTAIATGVPSALFNGVMGARLTVEERDAAIDRARRFFAEQGVSWLWWTGPATRPGDLSERLQARGFARWFETLGMAIDLRTLPGEARPPDRVTIERVADVETFAEWLRVARIANDLPPKIEAPLLAIGTDLGFDAASPYQRYLARLEGKPVATSSLFLGAGVAGLYTVGTLAEVRRRGIGTAVTVAPLVAARERGYRAAILSASRMGEPIYRRLGFLVLQSHFPDRRLVAPHGPTIRDWHRLAPVCVSTDRRVEVRL